MRGGLFNAVTYKFKINDWSAGEGIASFQYNGLIVTGLYTIQNPWEIEGAPMQWYYGGGAHAGIVGSSSRLNDFEGGLIIGVDGVIGAEYTFGNIPLNLSLDYKPAFNLIGSTGFVFDTFSLGIRYVLD